MEMLNGGFSYENDYYDVVFNRLTNQKVMVKNPGCQANAEELACTHWGIEYDGRIIPHLKVFSLRNSPEIDLNKIPKKYHKYFN